MCSWGITSRPDGRTGGRAGRGIRLELILTLLIAALLTGALTYMDGILDSIVPIVLHAEEYMDSLMGVDWFGMVYEIFFGVGISLIVLKFLTKGFHTYVSWTEGDPDADPLSLVTHFLRALVVAVSFPTLYGWLSDIVSELIDRVLEAMGVGMDFSLNILVEGITSAGLFTALLSLIFFIMFLVLYVQFLGRGLELLILRVGLPFACVGLIDSDKGVFGPYIRKFFQHSLTVIIQIALCKLSIGLMLNLHGLWGIAAMLVAMKAPKFLQEFLLPTSWSGMNMSYQGMRLVQFVRHAFSRGAAAGGGTAG